MLHLQCKGIAKIENLDVSAPAATCMLFGPRSVTTHADISRMNIVQEYTGLKTLYLEQNAIDTIENVDALVELRCLYLARNALTRIGIGLQCLQQLDTLDLSENYITNVDGLSCLPKLSTLNLSGNKLRRAENVAHLAGVPSLTSLDLANNAIDEPAAIDLVAGIKLSYLRLMGNPAVREYK